REGPSGGCVTQPDAREGQAGPFGVAERFAVPTKPGNAGGGKGPQFQVHVRRGESQESGVNLVPPETVRKLQETLQAKAKRAPSYRFYTLYDKVYRKDILEFAYLCCRSNDGAPGVDGQTFEDTMAQGYATWLGALAEELRKKTYRPHPTHPARKPQPLT